MSTLRSCPGGDALVSLLYDDFEPGATPSRDALSEHVRDCATCTAELEALGGVRMQLSAWTAPDVPLGFEVVRTGAPPLTGWRRTFADWSARSARFVPAAAAAIVVVGGALALARLDVRYDDAGFTVRTGWGHSAPAAGAPAGADDAAGLRRELAALRADVARLNAGRGTAVTATSLGSPVGDDTAPMAVSAHAGPAAFGAGAFTSAQGDALLRKFRQALDESEVRQQQNLQLRINEVTRDFELQRRQDLVQVEQGFGRIDNKNQQMLDYIRRVSLGQMPQQ